MSWFCTEFCVFYRTRESKGKKFLKIIMNGIVLSTIEKDADPSVLQHPSHPGSMSTGLEMHNSNINNNNNTEKEMIGNNYYWVNGNHIANNGGTNIQNNKEVIILTKKCDLCDKVWQPDPIVLEENFPDIDNVLTVKCSACNKVKKLLKHMFTRKKDSFKKKSNNDENMRWPNILFDKKTKKLIKIKLENIWRSIVCSRNRVKTRNG